MTNQQLIEAALQAAGDLEWKVKNFKKKRDIGIFRIEGHPTYLRIITWKKNPTLHKLVFNIEVWLVSENKRIEKRLVTDHELEVDYADA